MIDLLEKNMELVRYLCFNCNILVFQFENSFIILLGDHGYRIGKREVSLLVQLTSSCNLQFRRTEIGRLEVNNPYLSISIPKKLRETSEILETMRQNAKRLQTHFDTRATLLDVVKVEATSETDLNIIFSSNQKPISATEAS